MSMTVMAVSRGRASEDWQQIKPVMRRNEEREREREGGWGTEIIKEAELARAGRTAWGSDSTTGAYNTARM